MTDAMAALISKLTRMVPLNCAEPAARVADLFFREQRDRAIGEAARLGISRRQSARRFALSKSLIHRVVDAERRIDPQPPEDHSSEK